MWDSPATLAMPHPANCEVSNNVQCRARVVVYQDAILVNPKVVVVVEVPTTIIRISENILSNNPLQNTTNNHHQPSARNSPHAID